MSVSQLQTSLLKGQLIKAVSSGLQLRVMSIVAGLASSVVLARALGPEGYGIYGFVLAVLAILSIPMQIGLPTLVLRVTAQALALEDWATLRGIWFWSLGVVFAGTAGVLIFFILGMAVFSDSFTEMQRRVLAIGLPLSPIIAIEQVRASAMRGLKHIWFSGLPDKVIRPVLVSLLICIASLVSEEGNVSVELSMAIAVVSAIVALFVGGGLFLRSRPIKYVENKIRRIKNRVWLRSIVPLSLIGGVQIIMQYTDLLMLGILRTSVEVGQYRVAVSLATLAVFGLTVVNLVVQPYFAEAHAVKDKHRLQYIASAASTVSFLVSLTLIPMVWFFGEWGLFFLYGKGYGEAYLPLFILILGHCASAWCGSVGGVLAMVGHDDKVLLAVCVAAVSNVSLNLFLIPKWGLTGAALATGFSIALKNFLWWYQLRKAEGVDSSPLGFRKIQRIS